MSRIPENDDYDEDQQRRHNLWRGNAKRELKGKRGQEFLRELLAALEALPDKRLIEGEVAKDGAVCALGSLALKRRVDAGEDPAAVVADLEKVNVDPWEGECIWDWAERELKAPTHIAWLVPYENDDDGSTFDYVTFKKTPVTPEMRYERMVAWVRARLAGEPE